MLAFVLSSTYSAPLTLCKYLWDYTSVTLSFINSFRNSLIFMVFTIARGSRKLVSHKRGTRNSRHACSARKGETKIDWFSSFLKIRQPLSVAIIAAKIFTVYMRAH